MVILTPYVLDVVVHTVENLALLTLLNTFEEYFCFDQRSSKILSCDVHSYVFNYFPDITEPNQTTVCYDMTVPFQNSIGKSTHRSPIVSKDRKVSNIPKTFINMK